MSVGGAPGRGGAPGQGGDGSAVGGAGVASGGTQAAGGSGNTDKPLCPFPQNVQYPYGVQSSKVTSNHVRAWYDAWSATYLQECSGHLWPGVDPLTKSLVEAQGFAMVAAAYMGDKVVFDKLYEFYKAKFTTSGGGLMGWKNSCDGWEDQGAATNGDVDVASGLGVANWQWPGQGYDVKANGVLSNLKKVVLDCSGTLALYPGCSDDSGIGASLQGVRTEMPFSVFHSMSSGAPGAGAAFPAKSTASIATR